jgi:ABC-type sugar transport system substrate-binding protein
MKNITRMACIALTLTAPMGAALTQARADDKPLKISFITHDLGAGIFAPVRSGMEDACAKIHAECEFLGPATYDPSQHDS